MKNILLCSPRNITGGISQWTEYIIDYYNNLNSSNINLTWYFPTLSEKKLSQSLNKYQRIIRGLKAYLPFIFGLSKAIKNNNIDTVHLCTSGNLSFIRDYIALRLCKHFKIKTCLHLHFGRIPEILSTKSFERKLFELCLNYCDTVIAIDKKTEKSLLDLNLKNIVYLPNPLSPKIENLITNDSNITREKGLIVFAGHAIKTKGIFELVKACSEIKGIKLEILGKCTPETKEELLSIDSNNNPTWLQIRGNCSINEVIRAMLRCSIFVLPSYSEGFPNVIIESMACGTPIIASEVGAIPEMLDIYNNPCGIIVKPRDYISLKDSINYLLSSNEYSATLGYNASQRVRSEYSIKTVWSKLINIWQK